MTSQEIGILNIYRLSMAQIDAVIAKLEAEIVFKGLTTDFVKLDKFIQKLSIEHHTGYIEVFSKTNELMGTLYLKEGGLTDLHIPSEIQDYPISEPKAIPSFLEDVIRQGGIFDVYKSLVVSTPSEEQRSESESKTRDDKLNQSNIEQEIRQEKADIAEVTPNEEKKEYAEPDTNGRGDALGAFQDIIARTEEFVDGFSREGIFLRAFKRALIERSDMYPFLDPFTDQFDYKLGKMMLDEEVQLEHFGAGIAESFNLTLAHLKKEFPKNMNLSGYLKTELESKFKQYEDAMRRSGVQSVPQVFFK
jgi:hypothetical protein